MAGYDERPVPRGTSHRWEVLIADAETARLASRRRMAIEVQGEHHVLHEIPDSVLREIPLVDQGEPLQRRREYLDLHDPARADFRAEGTEIVKPGQRIVARAEVSDEAWSQLRGACDRVARRRPERLARDPRLRRIA